MSQNEGLTIFFVVYIIVYKILNTEHFYFFFTLFLFCVVLCKCNAVNEFKLCNFTYNTDHTTEDDYMGVCRAYSEGDTIWLYQVIWPKQKVALSIPMTTSCAQQHAWARRRLMLSFTLHCLRAWTKYASREGHMSKSLLSLLVVLTNCTDLILTHLVKHICPSQSSALFHICLLPSVILFIQFVVFQHFGITMLF